jgi:hypothetical protein
LVQGRVSVGFVLYNFYQQFGVAGTAGSLSIISFPVFTYPILEYY